MIKERDSLPIVIIALLVTLLFFVVNVNASVIAKNPNGIVIQMKEKYGGVHYDTCTVLTLKDGQYYATHYDKPTTVYNAINYTPVKIQKLRGKKWQK